MRRTAEPGSASPETRRRLGRVAFHCLVWSLVVVVLVPLIWPLLVALNDVSVEALADRGIRWWLRGVEFDAVTVTLAHTPFLRVLANSVLVATASALCSAALAATGAYGLARFDFAGRRAVAGVLLAIPMIPQTLVAIPLFLHFRTLGLFDSRVGLVVAYVAFTLPFTTWLSYALFTGVSARLEEAAMVDGCTRFGAFVRVFLPAARPALAAAFAFGWILAYNEYLFAVVLITDPAKRTLTVGIRYGLGDPGVVAVLAALPTLLVFGLLWRYVLAGEVRQSVE